MMPENPTDAVLDRMTVPAGSRRADELARPMGLTFSAVSPRYSCRSPRSCHTSASVNHGTVHSSGIQYSGCWRLGVWPDSRRATNRVRTTSQRSGTVPTKTRRVNQLVEGPQTLRHQARNRRFCFSLLCKISQVLLLGDQQIYSLRPRDKVVGYRLLFDLGRYTGIDRVAELSRIQVRLRSAEAVQIDLICAKQAGSGA